MNEPAKASMKNRIDFYSNAANIMDKQSYKVILIFKYIIIANNHIHIYAVYLCILYALIQS